MVINFCQESWPGATLLTYYWSLSDIISIVPGCIESFSKKPCHNCNCIYTFWILLDFTLSVSLSRTLHHWNCDYTLKIDVCMNMTLGDGRSNFTILSMTVIDRLCEIIIIIINGNVIFIWGDPHKHLFVKEKGVHQTSKLSQSNTINIK